MEKEAGQAFSLQDTGETCFQKQGCKSGCCCRSAENRELYCPIKGSPRGS